MLHIYNNIFITIYIYYICYNKINYYNAIKLTTSGPLTVNVNSLCILSSATSSSSLFSFRRFLSISILKFSKARLVNTGDVFFERLILFDTGRFNFEKVELKIKN